jgi:hypothetical protein
MSTNSEGRSARRILSTGYDAALARAVRAEQREPGPVRPEPSTAILRHLTAAHEHASGSRRTQAERMAAQSATARVAHRAIPACTGAPQSAALCTFLCPLCWRIPKGCSLHTASYAGFDAS